MIDINTAPAEEIDAVPQLKGHGFEIVRYRDERGRFDTARGGGCVDGTITLNRVGDKLYYSWFGIDGGDYFTAMAVLEKDASSPGASTAAPAKAAVTSAPTPRRASAISRPT